MLRNLNIGTRLGAGFALILAAVAAMLVTTMVVGAAARGRVVDALHEAAAIEADASELQVALLDSAVAVRNMGLQTAVDAVQRDQAEAKSRRAAAVAARQRLEARSLDEASHQSLKRLAVLDADMATQFASAVDLASMFNAEQAAGVITTKIDPLLKQAKVELASFVQLQKRQAEATTASATALSQAVERSVAATGVAVILLSALLAWRLTVSITQPLMQAEAVTQRVASGDLSAPIAVVGHDEAARLLGALRQMQGKLSEVVARVRQNSESVASASSEIATGNSDLSMRTEQQASALQETAASMEQLGTAVRHNADNASQANQLARGASEVAQRGGDVVGEVVETMRGINESSRRIGDIIGVIDGIAFQTNILALNAAVEAARAGEQGRGFAVVAGEVRNLAQRSAEAAREIKQLIAASVERVERGTAQVDRAGATMKEIVGAVGRVTDIMGEISSASAQQSAGVAQVGNAVGQMDTATQQNAALVEESAAAAESLRGQARELVEAVAVFRLSPHEG
jgi:methyl-accepting chemotaxis protein